MIRETKQYFVKSAILFICMLFSACDFNCREIMSGSPLRRYTPFDRIEKINNEISRLKGKENDLKTRARLGDLHEQLATIRVEQEEMDAALSDINSAFKYGRNTAYLNYLAGIVYGNRGAKSGSKNDILKAEEYYRNAVTIKPDYKDAQYSLAILLFFYKNQREEPISILEKLYIKSRSDYRIRFALGRTYYESGRKNDALIVYSELCSDLDKLNDSPLIQEYRRVCKENILKIQKEFM